MGVSFFFVKGDCMIKTIIFLITLGLTVSVTSISFSKNLIEMQKSEHWKSFTRDEEISDLQIQCSGWSVTNWYVSFQNDSVEYSSDWKPQEGVISSDELSFKVEADSDVPGSYNGGIIFPVVDGYLVAFNAGEWGGSLWWYSKDGLRRNKLLSEHINYFIKTENGLFAIGGLAHLSFDSGQIIKLEENNGTWSQKKIQDLDSAPNGFFYEGNDSYLILTNKSILRFSEKNGISKVYLSIEGERFPYSYATSIVKDNTGNLYLGMRYAIIKLSPQDEFYSEEWLIPDFCNWEVESNGVCHCK